MENQEKTISPPVSDVPEDKRPSGPVETIKGKEKMEEYLKQKHPNTNMQDIIDKALGRKQENKKD